MLFILPSSAHVDKPYYLLYRLAKLTHMQATPPLKSLLAFDAAMRKMSFSIAADELAVTPGAISQQIGKLEEWLGVALFVREVRRIRPTPDAQDYWATIQPALAGIRVASLALRDRNRQEVRLSVPPTLAAKWFAPRMGDFMNRHPTVSLHLLATTALADFERDTVDLAIRHFDGKASHLDATRLLPDEARLFCSPGYAESLDLQTPADLTKATLLHTTLHPQWPAWLTRFAAMSPPQIAALPVLRFNQTLLAIEAARDGRGVLLCNRLLVQAELNEGRLIEPFDAALPNDAYYVVHPRGTRLRPAAQLLKDWLLQLTPISAEGNLNVRTDQGHQSTDILTG